MIHFQLSIGNTIIIDCTLLADGDQPDPEPADVTAITDTTATPIAQPTIGFHTETIQPFYEDDEEEARARRSKLQPK